MTKDFIIALNYAFKYGSYDPQVNKDQAYLEFGKYAEEKLGIKGGPIMKFTKEEAGVLLNLIAAKIDKDAYIESEGYNTALINAQKKLLVIAKQ